MVARVAFVVTSISPKISGRNWARVIWPRVIASIVMALAGSTRRSPLSHRETVAFVVPIISANPACVSDLARRKAAIA